MDRSHFVSLISDEHDGHDLKKQHKHNDYEDDHHSYKPRKKSKLFTITKFFWTYPGENTLMVHLLKGGFVSNGVICSSNLTFRYWFN